MRTVESENSENEVKSKEEELQALLRGTKFFEALLKSPGWKQLQAMFAPAFIQLEETILNNATRTHAGKAALDGMQAAQIEAMEKGTLKGMKNVLNFPERWLAQAKDDIETLRRTIALQAEEVTDGTE